MMQRSFSTPRSKISFTESHIIGSESFLGADLAQSIILPRNISSFRSVSPNRPAYVQRQYINPSAAPVSPIFNRTPQQYVQNFQWNAQKPKKVYDVILRKGQDFYNFDTDVDNIFKVFSLPSWISNRFNVSIKTFEVGVHGIPCYNTTLKLTPKYNSSKTNLYFFQVQKDVVNRKVIYFIQTTSQPFLRSNCIIVEGKIDLVNEFLVIKINDYEDFFRNNFQRPVEELFEFTIHGHRINQLSYPYIQPINISNREDHQQHYFVMFRGGGARSLPYVGAYKAMLAHYPLFHQKLRGIIGASVGSFISLAMVTQQSPDFINQMLQQLSFVGERDKTVKTEREVLSKQLHYQQIQLKIKQVLFDYGIMQTQMFDLLHQTVWSNPIVLSKFLTAISGNNITLQQSMTLQSDNYDNYSNLNTIVASSNNLIIPQISRKKLLGNFYGVLDGYLLKGQYILQLSLQLISRYLIKKIQQNPRLVQMIFGTNPLQLNSSNIGKISKRMTMKNLFQLSGKIQFSVVSVDLDSQLLRFLNHKTSPDLPVANAIQIAFAMPFLVKLPKWKSSWGKYYIHYRNRRKQVDLTGHAFADGSIVDSSPAVFLLNQRLRQNYFSYKPNQHSRFMAFGNYLSEQGTQKVSRERLFQDFFQVLKMTAPIERLLNISRYPPPPTFYPFESLSKPTDIPLIGVFTKIQQTIKSINANTIKETFWVRAHLLPQNCNLASFLAGRTAYSIDQRFRSYHALRDSVHDLKDTLSHININRKSILIILAEIIQRLDQPQYQQDSKYILKIKHTVLSEMSSHAMYAQQQKKRYKLAQSQGGIAIPGFNQTIDKLQKMVVDVLDDVRLIYRFGYFFRQRFMRKDAKNLQNTIRKVVDIYTIDQNCSPILRPHMKLYIQNLFSTRRLEQYNKLNSLGKYLDKLLINMQNGIAITYDSQLYKSNQIYKNFRFESMPQYLQFALRLEELQQTLIVQDRAYEKQRQHSRFYIDGVLKVRTNNNLHIVFQSVGFHSKYLLQAYQQILEVITFDHYQSIDELYQDLASIIIKDNEQRQQIKTTFTVQDMVKFIIIRADLNQVLRNIMCNLQKAPIPRVIDLKYIQYHISQDLELKLLKTYSNHFKNKCAVKAISTSGFSSFFAFLIAAGVDAQTIQQELWGFKQHFEINVEEILQQYQTFDWAIKQQIKIRDLQELLWRSRYDVWSNIEKAARQNRLDTDLQKIKQQFQESRQPIMKSFTDVMNHIITSARQSNSYPNSMDYFARANSLNVYQNYYQINRQLAIETKKIISTLMCIFEEQIRVVIMHLSLQKVQQIIEIEADPLKRQAIWRGVVIMSFIKSDKYKSHIQKTLRRINLTPQIKLRQFYDVIPTKIDISINAIDFTEGKYVFLNRYTYPQMPLWAALIIGASYPLIFQEVHSRKSWLYHISLENTTTARRMFFNQIPQNERKAPLFGSGSLIDSFPLTLLTNPKVLESSFNNTDYTFLNFGLRTAPPRTYKMLGFYCRRFLDMNDLRQLFSGPSKVPYINQASKIFMKHSNIMNSYVASHDKLMQQLYSSNFIRLPSQVDLIEYHRFSTSDFFNYQTQQQAYFSTLEKFAPNSRPCYIQLKYTQFSVVLFFISKDKHRYDIFKDYNVYYKLKVIDNYQQINNSYQIKFNLTQYQIVYLKFSFIKDSSLIIKQGEYIIDVTTLRNFAQFDAVYQLKYTEIFNNLSSPCKVYTKIPKVPSRNQYADQIIIRSNIDVKKHGLFCQICCNSLQLNNLMFFQQRGRHKCLSCEKLKPTKYMCKTQNCPGAYCLNCVKDELFIKHVANTSCYLGHQLMFKGTKWNKQPKQYVRCDCCFEPNSFYYHDTVCGIKICNGCFTQVNVDTEAPPK